jgi:hypothetical protein
MKKFSDLVAAGLDLNIKKEREYALAEIVVEELTKQIEKYYVTRHEFE